MFSVCVVSSCICTKIIVSNWKPSSRLQTSQTVIHLHVQHMQKEMLRINTSLAGWCISISDNLVGSWKICEWTHKGGPHKSLICNQTLYNRASNKWQCRLHEYYSYFQWSVPSFTSFGVEDRMKESPSIYVRKRQCTLNLTKNLNSEIVIQPKIPCRV